MRVPSDLALASFPHTIRERTQVHEQAESYPSRRSVPPSPHRLRKTPEYPAAGVGAVIISLHPAGMLPSGDRAGVRDLGVPAGDGWGAMAGGVHRERAAEVPAGRDRGEAGRQAGEGHGAAPGRRAEHGAARRGPDRALPGPRPAPVGERWSRKHAHTQRRLCERFAAPVIDAVTCQDITTWHMQQIVNAAPTAGEGDRVRRDALGPGRGGHRGRVPDQPAAGEGALAGRRPAGARPPGHHGRGIGAVGRPRRDPAGGDVGKLGQALAEGGTGTSMS